MKNKQKAEQILIHFWRKYPRLRWCMKVTMRMKRRVQRETAALRWVEDKTTRTKPMPVPREHRTAIRRLAYHGEVAAKTIMLNVGTATRPRVLARYHASPL